MILLELLLVVLVAMTAAAKADASGSPARHEFWGISTGSEPVVILQRTFLD